MPTPLLLAARTVRIERYCTIVTWLNVCVVVWRDQTLALDVKALREVLRGLAKQHADGIGLIQYLDAQSSLSKLDSDARAEFLTVYQNPSLNIKHHAVIFEGDGFRASAVRAIVSGLAWLVRPRLFPHQVFSRIRDAAQAHSTFLAPQGSEERWAILLAEVIKSASAIRAARSIPPPKFRAVGDRA